MVRLFDKYRFAAPFMGVRPSRSGGHNTKGLIIRAEFIVGNSNKAGAVLSLGQSLHRKESYLMPRSLLRTILDLSQYEPRRRCAALQFLTAKRGLLDNVRVSRVIHAADNLIGNLFCYGKEINLGSRYFQPCFYKPLRLVDINWTQDTRSAFCRGCYRWDCSYRRFSSDCSRFGIAWAAMHVTINTNRLVQLLTRKVRERE